MPEHVGVPVEYPAPAEYGQRVRYRRQKGLSWAGRTARLGDLEKLVLEAELEGEGVFELHWMCLDEECWRVRLDGGGMVGLFPGFGDTMELVQ
jgi:hypothetical protein